MFGASQALDLQSFSPAPKPQIPVVIPEMPPRKSINSRNQGIKKRSSTPTIAFGGSRERSCMINYDVFQHHLPAKNSTLDQKPAKKSRSISRPRESKLQKPTVFATISEFNENDFNSNMRADLALHNFNPSSSQIIKQVKQKSRSVQKFLGISKSTSAKELSGALSLASNTQKAQKPKIQPSQQLVATKQDFMSEKAREKRAL